MSTEKVLRKSKVIPFLTSLEIDRQENFNNLVSKAKLLKLEGFERVVTNQLPCADFAPGLAAEQERSIARHHTSQSR